MTDCPVCKQLLKEMPAITGNHTTYKQDGINEDIRHALEIVRPPLSRQQKTLPNISKVKTHLKAPTKYGIFNATILIMKKTQRVTSG